VINIITEQINEASCPTRKKVEVNDGVVILTGTVPTWAAYQTILDTVTFTQNVKDIHDQLRVMS
jgi:osmotically-inducible protein OsmY